MDVRASIEATLEALGLVPAGGEGTHAPLFTQEREAPRRALSRMDCSRGAAQDRLMRAEAAGDPGPGVSKRCLVADAGCRRPARRVRDYALVDLADRKRFWFSTRRAFSSRAKPRAVCIASTRLGRQDHELYRSACSRLTPRGTVTRSYDRELYLPRTWTWIRPDWPLPMYRRGRAFRPSRDWLWL